MPKNYRTALPEGFLLDKYQLIRVLGMGGFGVTYLAEESELGREVVIKEHLPKQFASRGSDLFIYANSPQDEDPFKWSLKRFSQEAKILATLNHTQIVKVHGTFKANNTAYTVLAWEKGQNLKQILESRTEPFSQEQLEGLLRPLLGGLMQVHARNIVHRNIKPGNILLRETDQSPVLLDFGVARDFSTPRRPSTIPVLTQKYAPPEQYTSTGDQGPWTDIYAMGALIYRVIAGAPPPESVLRSARQDPLIPAEKIGRGRFQEHFLRAVDWALKLDRMERPPDIPTWASALFDRRRSPRASQTPWWQGS